MVLNYFENDFFQGSLAGNLGNNFINIKDKPLTRWNFIRKNCLRVLANLKDGPSNKISPLPLKECAGITSMSFLVLYSF